MATRKDEEKSLLKRSRDFLETAEYQISRAFYDLAAFSLEQALQLFLKAKVLAEGVDYPRTHSVRVLLEMLSNLAPGNKKSRGNLGKIFAGTGNVRRCLHNITIYYEGVYQARS